MFTISLALVSADQDEMGDTDPKEFRILRGNGSLGGYRSGLERKRALIDAERKAVS